MDAVSSATGGANLSAYYQNIIKYRQNAQQQRIDQGLSSGKLTQDQATQLGTLETQDQQLAQQAGAGGQISGSAFSGIMQAYDQTSQQIYAMKHPQGAQTTTPQGAQTDFSTQAKDILNGRQKFLAERLNAGVQSGLITPGEQTAIQAAQTQADSVVNPVLAGAGVNASQYLQAMKAQNVVSRDIASYVHNQQFTQAPTAVQATASLNSSV